MELSGHGRDLGFDSERARRRAGFERRSAVTGFTPHPWIRRYAQNRLCQVRAL